MPRFKLATAVLSLALVTAGCNVLDSAYEEGGTDVDTLIDDARHARAAERYDLAVELLEDAYDQEPSNAVVRLELGTTLMQREGLSSVSLVGDVTNFILEEIGAETGGRSAQRGGGEACSWTDAAPAEAFDPSEFESFQAIMDAAPVLRRVRDLIAGSDGAVLPTSLLDLSPCEAIQNGEVIYDHEAVMNELVARFGGNRTLARTALQLNTVVLTLDAYTGIFEQEDLPVDWFIVDSDRLGFCVEDENALDLLYSRIDPAVNNVGRALFSLDLLIYDGGNDDLDGLRDDAIEMYEAFEEDISSFCD